MKCGKEPCENQEEGHSRQRVKLCGESVAGRPVWLQRVSKAECLRAKVSEMRQSDEDVQVMEDFILMVSGLLINITQFLVLSHFEPSKEGKPVVW